MSGSIYVDFSEIRALFKSVKAVKFIKAGFR
jgi:hypothetical protein